MIKRVRTGIPGFDDLIYGGIPERSLVLLSGGPGTGKTIFAQQFIFEGVKNNDEGAVFVAFEEHPMQVRDSMQNFGWNMKDYEEKGKFALVDAFTSGFGKAKEEKYVIHDIGDINEIIDVIRNAVRNTNAKRIVIDSFTTIYAGKPASTTRAITLQLKRLVMGLNCTGLLINQTGPEKVPGGYGIEHLVDSIIKLDIDEKNGELIRSLVIWKMRGTPHSLKRHNFEITEKGIKIVPPS